VYARLNSRAEQEQQQQQQGFFHLLN
jgi:hypothetical protein